MVESPNPEWLDRWQALSRQYLGAWQHAAHPPAAQSTMAWPDGFEQWSRLFASGAGSQSETVERLIDSARSYAAFMQSMLAATNANAQAPGVSWTDALRSGFAAGGGQSLFEHPAARAWQGMAGQGDAGFAQLMSALHAPPADFADLKSWLGLPAFGYLREHQERYQKAAVAWVDYQEQMGRYNALMQKASQRGFELFEGKLAEREQPGRQIDSLRALYDLWVDAAEEGYAGIALSAEFREVYGALVNAQMRVRAQIQAEIERVGADLGMPTRSEINSIGKRLHALRREVRERGAGTGEALAGEVAALREELRMLKVATRSTKAAAPRAAGTAAVAEQARAAPRAKRLRKARPAVPAVPASKRNKRKAGKVNARAVPRSVGASAQNFASRIAKFAGASLGKPRAATQKPAATRKSKKKR
ncbi:MAG: class III poly(R)-hydroxyalkanoic acid synthase subunit PhaE [Lysobacterales bacterium]